MLEHMNQLVPAYQRGKSSRRLAPPAGQIGSALHEWVARTVAQGYALLSTAEAQQRIALVSSALFCVLYTTVMIYHVLLRYQTFTATAFDLGNMDQAVWNTLHGHPFAFTNQGIDYYGPATRLAIHVEPIIFLLAAIYALHADPQTLLVVQTLAIGAGGIAVFFLARRKLAEWPLAAPAFVAAYFLAPAVIGENIFDFHPVTLATPLLLAAALAIDARKYGWFCLAGVLAAATKEDVPLVVGLLGLYIAFAQGHRKLGLAVFVIGCIWTCTAFFVIIPHFYHGTVKNNFWYRYAALGDSPTAALRHLITQPWLLFGTLITWDKVLYVLGLLRSSGFLLLLAPWVMIGALPELVVNLSSTDWALYSGVYHYNALIIAFIIVATIEGAALLTRRWPALVAWAAPERRLARIRALYTSRLPWPWLPRRVMMTRLALGETLARLVRWIPSRFVLPAICLWLVLCAGANLYAAQPALSSFWGPGQVTVQDQRIDQLIAMIPSNVPVSASDTLDPHLSERQHIYLFPDIGAGQQIAQYIIVDFSKFFPESRAYSDQVINHLIASGQYVVMSRAGQVILLRHTTLATSGQNF
jgi:uncharacterized membrane protein